MKPIVDFFQIENLETPQVGILDIGAMLIEGQNKEYQPLLDAQIAKVIGFEPVQEECDKLNGKMQGKNIRFLPYFIGDGTAQTFCLNNASMTSSLYEANRDLLDLFQNLGELTVTVNREDVQTTKLDDISEIDIPIDYLKIDIQGAELQAFEGGPRILKNTTVIHTEVEWVPLYQDQPLFADVDLCLRENGFLLHQILGVGTRAFKPFLFNNNPNIGMQQLWSDAVFIKDFTKLDALSDRQLSVYAILMHQIYNAFDLSAHVLAELGKRCEKPLGDLYRHWLTSN